MQVGSHYSCRPCCFKAILLGLVLLWWTTTLTTNAFLILPNSYYHYQRTQGASVPTALKDKRLPHVVRPRSHPTGNAASVTSLQQESSNNNNDICSSSSSTKFNLTTALFCGGLAFDSYVEPAPNSSRWERGSKGCHVAFCSPSYTRQLYKGLLEVTVQEITGLPETQDSAAEQLLSQSRGVDACLLVAIVEGQWKEDIAILEKEQYHTGVLDLSGAAHVSRSSTCWSSVLQEQAEKSELKNGKPLPYFVPSAAFRPARAVWPDTEPPFYVYVQDPAKARLVLTVLDEDKFGTAERRADEKAVGSTYELLTDLIPQAKLPPEKLVEELKQQVLQEIRKSGGSLDGLDETMKLKMGASTWQGSLKLTSKPRKKDKNGQIFAGAAAGAAIAGPAGAAAGALFGSFYESQVQGAIHMKLRYLPIPPLRTARNTYRVKGGMPGIDWGHLYERYQLQALQETGLLKAAEDTAEDAAEDTTSEDEKEIVSPNENIVPSEAKIASDLEHCFFVSHQKTGATCAVYRSLQEKRIVLSFRGTCAPVDLITDASLIQEAWVEGDDIDNQLIPKVHVGFRTSLNSISRRLKELILAVPAPGDDISDYDMVVTGHSLGGALSTLFTADIGQYGIDAGRALPQLEPSEPWWKSVSSMIFSSGDEPDQISEPPRPKSLRMYNFGSPRVGNTPFAELFDALVDEGFIDEAFRIVNGEDVVARLPRTVNAFVFGSINYDHVGKTVLLSQPEQTEDGSDTVEQAPIVWIEGESDDRKCPVRDGVSLSSPTAEGTLLNDLMQATKESFDAGEVAENGDTVSSWTQRLTSAAGKVTDRMKQIKAADLASIVGIDKSFTDRELRMIQSLVQGKSLAHHLEDEYYAGMGRASGFLARVGEELVELEVDKETV